MTDVLTLYKESINFIKKRNAKLINSGGSDKECIDAICKVLDRYNLFLLLGEGYETRVWDDLLNENDRLKTFLIDETVFYIKNNIDSESTFNALVEHIAFSQCILNKLDSAVDITIIGGMPKVKQATNTLKSNPWLLYLSLLIDSFND